MAYMEGNSLEKNGDADKKRLAILMSSCVLVSVLVVYYSESRRVNFSIIVFTIVSCLLFALVYLKLHPMVWMRLLDKRKYSRFLELNKSIIDTLLELDDSYFILTNIIVELFYVEYLILSGRGIIVIGIVDQTAGTGIKDRLTGADAYSPLRKISGLWRVCHFLNILIKKSFNADIMPQPVLVLPEAVPVPLNIPEGIIITTTHELKTTIGTIHTASMPTGLPESLAFFLKTRYVSD